MFKAVMSKIVRAALIVVSVTAMAFLAGCSAKPIIQTQVIDWPIPVHCEVKVPEECKESYAVGRVSAKDDPATINRAFRQESKQRKLKSELIENDAPKEQVKTIDDRITKLMAGLNQRIKDLRQEAR